MSQITEWIEGQDPQDACFIAGTLIATPTGPLPIEEIKEGQFIITPFGKGLVTFGGVTGIKPVTENIGLVGTPDHRVFSKERQGFFRLDSFSDNETSHFNLTELLTWQITFASYTLETGIVAPSRDTIISAKKLLHKKTGIGYCNIRSCISQYGKQLMGQSPLKGITSITWTLTQIIMILQTWFVYQVGNTTNSTKRGMRRIPSLLQIEQRNCTAYVTKLLHGMVPQRAGNGIKSTFNAHLQNHGNTDSQETVSDAEKNLSLQKKPRAFARIFAGIAHVIMRGVCMSTRALSAIKHLRIRWKPEANIAQANARAKSQDCQYVQDPVKFAGNLSQTQMQSKQLAERLVPTHSSYSQNLESPQYNNSLTGTAPFAGTPTPLRETKHDSAQCSVVQKPVVVYGLTVKGAGCYYANGVLVSNCDSASSALRQAYGILDTGADLLLHLEQAYGKQ
jgi:hypothetical protein